jgi:hypothetical protein
MKYLKQYMIIGAVTMITSCSDFLDTAPLDALLPLRGKPRMMPKNLLSGVMAVITTILPAGKMVAISYISTAGRILDITTLNGKTIRPLATVQ